MTAGVHFLMIRSGNHADATQVNLVRNWIAEVGRLAPTPWEPLSARALRTTPSMLKRRLFFALQGEEI